MQEMRTVDNLEIHADKVLVSVNPKIFSLEMIQSAAYSMVDEAYVVIQGEPVEEIVVQLRPKSGADLEELGRRFNNELLNYAVYINQSKRNLPIKTAIMQRALATNAAASESKPEKETDKKNTEKPEDELKDVFKSKEQEECL